MDKSTPRDEFLDYISEHFDEFIEECESKDSSFCDPMDMDSQESVKQSPENLFSQCKNISSCSEVAIEEIDENEMCINDLIEECTSTASSLNVRDNVPTIENYGDEPEAVGVEMDEEETIDECPKIITRKRPTNSSNWKVNQRKNLRAAGKRYMSSRGKEVPAKSIQTIKDCLNSCRFRCGAFISETERKHIFESFYKLDLEGKKHYLLKTTEKCIPARRRGEVIVSQKSVKSKKNSFKYYFFVRETKIQVCKVYFLSTLNISQKRIYLVQSKKNIISGTPTSSQQGKHTKRITADHLIEAVKSHINSFPCIESHYCRKNSNKKYLEASLTISEMFRMYKEKAGSDETVKFNVYRHIFNTQFNLSFHKPKKDRCDLCEEHKMAVQNTTLSDDDELVLKYNAHFQEKEEAYKQRQVDRENKIPVLCFDMQNVLTCPKADVSSFFYHSKLNVYNLTGHFSLNNKVYCCLWDESRMGRTGNDIASALLKILNRIMEDCPGITEIILWSDSCVPQNRNSLVTFILLDFLRHHPYIQRINFKFSTPGHSTIQEIDNAHSCIERVLRTRDFYSPLSLIRILLKMTFKKQNLTILQMQPSDFKNVSECCKIFNFKLIPFSKIVRLQLTQNLTQVLFQISHLEKSFENVDLKCSKTLRNKNTTSFQWPNLKELPLKNELAPGKIKSFNAMLKYMPAIDKEFFINIMKNRTNMNAVNN